MASTSAVTSRVSRSLIKALYCWMYGAKKALRFGMPSMVQLRLSWNKRRRLSKSSGRLLRGVAESSITFLRRLFNRPTLTQSALQIFCKSSYFPEPPFRKPCASSTIIKSNSSFSLYWFLPSKILERLPLVMNWAFREIPNSLKVFFQLSSREGGKTTRTLVFLPLASIKRFAIMVAMMVLPKPTTSARNRPLCFISIW